MKNIFFSRGYSSLLFAWIIIVNECKRPAGAKRANERGIQTMRWTISLTIINLCLKMFRCDWMSWWKEQVVMHGGGKDRRSFRRKLTTSRYANAVPSHGSYSHTKHHRPRLSRNPLVTEPEEQSVFYIVEHPIWWSPAETIFKYTYNYFKFCSWSSDGHKLWPSDGVRIFHWVELIPTRSPRKKTSLKIN